VASDHDFQNATMMNRGIDIEQDIDVYEMTITMTLNFQLTSVGVIHRVCAIFF